MPAHLVLMSVCMPAGVWFTQHLPECMGIWHHPAADFQYHPRWWLSLLKGMTWMTGVWGGPSHVAEKVERSSTWRAGFQRLSGWLKKEKAIIIPQAIHMKLYIQLFKPLGKNYFNLQKCTYTYTWIPQCATLSQLVWQPTYPCQKARHVTILSKKLLFF